MDELSRYRFNMERASLLILALEKVSWNDEYYTKLQELLASLLLQKYDLNDENNSRYEQQAI